MNNCTFSFASYTVDKKLLNCLFLIQTKLLTASIYINITDIFTSFKWHRQKLHSFLTKLKVIDQNFKLIFDILTLFELSVQVNSLWFFLKQVGPIDYILFCKQKVKDQ